MSMKLHKKSELDTLLKKTQNNLTLYKSSYLQNLKVDQYVDILIAKKDYKICKILKNSKYSIQVLPDGYPKTEIEQIQKSNHYVNPFKTKTKIYTSPLKNCIRYYDMENIENLLSYWILKLNQFDFDKKIDCYEILNDLRGELFIFLDFLFCFSEPLPSTYYLKILELMKSFVLFMNYFFNFFLKHAFLGFFLDIDSELFLVDHRLAFISCLPEFFYILKCLLGESPKKIRLFGNLDSDFWNQQEEGKEFKNYKDFFFDFIKTSNIFDCVFKISCFSFKIESKKKIEILKINAGHLIPIYDFLITIILNTSKIDERKLFLYKTEKSLDEFLLNFSKSDAELTDIHNIYNLYKIRKKINELTKKYEIETNFNEISFEELKINVLFFYLKSQNFKKNIKTSKYLNSYLTLKTSKKLKKHISNKFLQKDIIKILYGKNANNDLIKNTHEFVEFIAPYINFELLTQMFEFKKNANLAKIVEIDHALKVFMRYMDYNILNETIQKIYLNLNEINFFVLSFLIECVVINKDSKVTNFFSNLFFQIPDKNLESIRLETLTLLYKLLADPNIQIDKKILRLCLNGFKKILDEFSPKKVIQKYFEISFRKFNEKIFNLEIVELLFYISEKIIIKKGFLGIGKSSNLDDSFLKQYNICKIMQNFLENNYKRMEISENEIFLEFFFKFYTNIIQKLDLNLERQFFKAIVRTKVMRSSFSSILWTNSTSLTL